MQLQNRLGYGGSGFTLFSLKEERLYNRGRERKREREKGETTSEANGMLLRSVSLLCKLHFFSDISFQYLE
jgi:hypothetical protein